MQKLLTKNEKKYVSDLIYYTIDEIKNFKNGNVIVVKDKKDILFFVDEAKLILIIKNYILEKLEANYLIKLINK